VSSPWVRVDSLRKVFKDRKRGMVRAVDGISFEVHGGEIFALLGPNGAGKTTTLRILSTILRPTGGRAEVMGYDVVKNPQEVRKKIGYLPAEGGLYHRLTPREVVTFFGELAGMDRKTLKDRTEQLFESIGITDFADTKIEKLSTGMKQKVAIARTIIHDPDVLILDEPTQGLDVPSSRIVEQFILDEREKGKAIVLSTHIMEEAEYLADRIFVIHKGREKATGTIDQLKKTTGKNRLKEVFLSLLEA